jgi:hypothetical protein
MIISFIWAVAALNAPTAVPDPLAPGREGWLGCVDPDVERKVCLSLKHYRWVDDKIIIDGQMLIAAEPLTIMKYRDEAIYVGDAVCSWTQNIEAAIISISVNGETLTGDIFRTTRRDISAPLLHTAGQKYCVTFEPRQAGGFVMQPSLNDVRQPEGDRTMIWVRPDDGWNVRL